MARELKRWSDDDVEYIRLNYLKKSDAIIADALGRSVRAIKDIRSEYGFLRSQTTSETRAWHTDEEIYEDHPCVSCEKDAELCNIACTRWERWFRATWRLIRKTYGKR